MRIRSNRIKLAVTIQHTAQGRLRFRAQANQHFPFLCLPLKMSSNYNFQRTSFPWTERSQTIRCPESICCYSPTWPQRLTTPGPDAQVRTERRGARSSRCPAHAALAALRSAGMQPTFQIPMIGTQAASYPPHAAAAYPRSSGTARAARFQRRLASSSRLPAGVPPRM